MGHFAKVVNGIVEQVIVADFEFFKSFVDTSPGEWIQTSYNTRYGVHLDPETGLPSEDQTKALRKNYAGIGYTYDRLYDAFIPPKVYESWVLDESTWDWAPPVPYPTDGKVYDWDETDQTWVEQTLLPE